MAWTDTNLQEAVQKLVELQTEELRRREQRDAEERHVGPQPSSVKVRTPSFSGEEGQPVETFLDRFAKVAAYNKWDDAAALLHLQDALKGKAQGCARHNTVDGVKEALRGRFAMKPRDARLALTMLRYQEGGCIEDHAQKVRDLTGLAYGAGVLQAGARNDLELDSFLGSLGSGRLRAHLAAMRPADLSEAVAGAKEYLVCFPLHKGGTPAARSFDCEDAEDALLGGGTRPTPPGLPNPALSGAAGGGTAVAATTDSQQDMMGLMRELIITLKAQQASAAPAAAPPRQRRRAPLTGAPGTCWLCGQAGHYARECPRRHPGQLEKKGLASN